MLLAQTAEIITLLYETTLGPPSLDHSVGLNPTAGVVPKPQGIAKGLIFKSDPTRPGRGVFVAHGKAKEGDYRDLPEGTVVISQGLSDEESEGEESAAEVSVRPTNDSASSSSTHPHSAAGSGPPSAPRARTSATAGMSDAAAQRVNTPRSLAMHRTFPRNVAISGAGQGTGAEVADDAAGRSSLGVDASMVNYMAVGPNGNLVNVNPAMNSGGGSDVVVMNTLEANPQPNVLDEMHVADTGFLEGIPGGMFDWRSCSAFSALLPLITFSSPAQWETFFSRFSMQGTDANAIAFAQAHAQSQQRRQQHRQSEHGLTVNAGQQQQYQS